jgi:hypothetical protein
MAANANDDVSEILKDLLIVQLGMAQVSQPQIRKIVHCSMNRVNDIVKHLRVKDRGAAR